MRYMFFNCSSLQKLNLSSFIINQATNTKKMFYSINNACKINSENKEILDK